MKLKKAPAELVEVIARAMEGIECERRILFGYPAFFINNNMFAGLLEDRLFFRLSPTQLESLNAAAGPLANLEAMQGRPMKDYWVMPPALVSDATRLHDIAVSAAEHARSLAPKARKAPKKSSRSPGRSAKNKAKNT